MSYGNAGVDAETCNSDERVGCSRSGDVSSNSSVPSNIDYIPSGTRTLGGNSNQDVIQNTGVLSGGENHTGLASPGCSRKVIAASCYSASVDNGCNRGYSFVSPPVSTGEDQPSSKGTTPPCPVVANASPNCAVCNTTCSKQRACSRCGQFIHHFCSHDVCISLHIRGPDGQLMEDFGENSYCSKHCYEAITNLGQTPSLCQVVSPTPIRRLVRHQ